MHGFGIRSRRRLVGVSVQAWPRSVPHASIFAAMRSAYHLLVELVPTPHAGRVTCLRVASAQFQLFLMTLAPSAPEDLDHVDQI